MDDFADMDAFLASSVKAHTKASELEHMQNVRLGAKRGSDEWAVANAYVQKWDKSHNWEHVGVEVHIRVTTCSCGYCARELAGFFRVERRKRDLSTKDYIAMLLSDVAQVDLGAAKVVEMQSAVNVCLVCWWTKGKKREEETRDASAGRGADAREPERADEHEAVLAGGAEGAVWEGEPVSVGTGEEGSGAGGQS